MAELGALRNIRMLPSDTLPVCTISIVNLTIRWVYVGPAVQQALGNRNWSIRKEMNWSEITYRTLSLALQCLDHVSNSTHSHTRTHSNILPPTRQSTTVCHLAWEQWNKRAGIVIIIVIFYILSGSPPSHDHLPTHCRLPRSKRAGKVILVMPSGHAMRKDAKSEIICISVNQKIVLGLWQQAHRGIQMIQRGRPKLSLDYCVTRHRLQTMQA